MALAVQGACRRHDDALVAFSGAARLDPALDLASLDGFWLLPRAGQQVAVNAYEAAAQSREAAKLDATRRGTYRSQAVPRRGDRAIDDDRAARMASRDL